MIKAIVRFTLWSRACWQTVDDIYWRFFIHGKFYRDVWAQVRDHFFDRARLSDWDSWQHRFDGRMCSRRSERQCIDKMLSSLGDKYTRLLSDEDSSFQESFVVSNAKSVFSRKLRSGFGYVRIRAFGQDNVVAQVETALNKLVDSQGYIVDLRGNIGGLIDRTAECCELFMDSGLIYVMDEQFAEGIVRNEVMLDENEFVSKKELVNLQFASPGPKTVDRRPRRRCITGKKPIVLLIDGDTMSSAELFASALLFNGREDGRIVAIGTQTLGKTVAQLCTEPNGMGQIALTYAKWYGPDGVWLGDGAQVVASGIKPHEEVKGLRAQRLAALAHLEHAVQGKAA